MKYRSQLAPLSIVLLSLSLAAALGQGCGDSSSAPAQTTPEPGVSPSPSASVAAGNQVAVSIPQGSVGQGSQAFGPNPLIIQTGATVTWTNNDTVPHTVTAIDNSFDSGPLAPGETFQHTFTAPGDNPYFCSIHGQSSMSGSIRVVDELPGASPSPSPSASPSPSQSPGTGGGSGGGGYGGGGGY